MSQARFDRGLAVGSTMTAAARPINAAAIDSSPDSAGYFHQASGVMLHQKTSSRGGTS
jgi:hypothetical protein